MRPIFAVLRYYPGVRQDPDLQRRLLHRLPHQPGCQPPAITPEIWSGGIGPVLSEATALKSANAGQ